VIFLAYLDFTFHLYQRTVSTHEIFFEIYSVIFSIKLIKYSHGFRMIVKKRKGVFTMKNILKVFGIIALVAIIGFTMAACGDGDGGGGGGGGKLPSSLQNKTYTNSSGDKLEFGTNNVKVTLSGGETKTFKFWELAQGYLFFENSRDEVIEFTNNTLGMVKLTFPSGVKILGGTWTETPGGQTPGGNKDLTGTITISPSTGVTTNTELTATYSGSETVSYQWKKDGSNVGTASTTKPNKYTPTTAGSYTVTVSLSGYNSKTSSAVTVTGGNQGSNPLNGTTWTGSMYGMSLVLTFTGNTFLVVGSGQTFDSGTYTVSGSTVNFVGEDGPLTGTLNGQTLTVNGIGTFTKQ
jgi:hypothetical protein